MRTVGAAIALLTVIVMAWLHVVAGIAWSMAGLDVLLSLALGCILAGLVVLAAIITTRRRR